MSLVPYDPFRQLANIRKEFERLFSTLPVAFNWENSPFHQINIDIHESDTEVIAICDLPGIENKEDLHIHVEDELLSIGGTIHTMHEVKKESMYRQERYSGSFHRTVTLPSPVSGENIKAVYKNGVLEVRMVKTSKKKKRRIDIDFN
ncbi:Hsp20/alpha crystallin family protein [Lysinibacillus odysseyi]|uniref:Heat-shock protein Hsp20 n=1 Tax=Lysinibacillus odysseyi 34hs-1 = NBRC 100172 TaxID=1220589 RepID=A0A0A3ITG6_9BACI|nr:Hsp20/alpha crystallin family protein [Lysinibacillus odysseyi]KGR86168.1 heat-shock protein Hsp20 [Lysinibacillus odysseyi 34hs-1 = NBRC 100172]